MDNKTILENAILSSLCKQILETDDSIRFVGVANKFGTKIASEYRKELVPLLTESQSQLSAIESAIRMRTRMGEKDIESKLGKPIYSFTLYEKKIKRATFLLNNEDYPFLMVSLDKQVGRGASVQEEEAVATVDDECVTLNKILSIVKQQIQFDLTNEE